MANLTTLSSGSSVVLTVTDQQSIVLNNGRSDVARLQITTGPGAGSVVTASHNGRRVYGPFGAGTITLSAVSGDVRYELSGDSTSPLDDDGQPLSATENQTVRALVSGDGIVPHPRYWFHGSAVRQSADDGVFRDMVAGNHGVFGANLSRANAWTNRGSGYVSTVDPVGGSTDSVIRIPGPNYDYAGGESLFIMWAGQVTPEGSDASLMGTSASTSAKGVRIRANSTGRLSFVLYDTTPTSAFSTTSTDNALGKPFVSGERHSFAIFIDGRNRLQYMWVDGLINVNGLTLSSGTSVDTLSSGTWNIGAASQSPGGTEGIATKTLAFAGFKFLATDDLPAIADLTAVAQAFDNDPSALVAQGAM